MNQSPKISVNSRIRLKGKQSSYKIGFTIQRSYFQQMMPLVLKTSGHFTGKYKVG
uniref:Uncharacterized protein n=1 Tax=Rhodnius prolixus TaxID=13249 RepID=A0A905QX32_RHOPR